MDQIWDDIVSYWVKQPNFAQNKHERIRSHDRTKATRTNTAMTKNNFENRLSGLV